MATLQIVSLLTLAALAAANCPDGFSAFGNNACYMPVAQKLPWNEAEQFCNAYSSCSSGGLGHLVSIHSEQENGFVHSLYNTLVFLEPGHFWIGYNDRRTQGQFEWTDGWTYPPGSQPFRKFGQGHPTVTVGHDCVSMDGATAQPGRQNQPGRTPEMWQTRDCTMPLAFVCIIEDAPSMECPAPSNPTRPGV